MNRLGALLVGLLWCCPAEATSRWLDFRLVYDVEPDCPPAAEFLARLNEHVAAGGDNRLEGRISIRRKDGAFVREMQLNGGEPSRARSDDCQALVDDAVMAAGMARTANPHLRAVEQFTEAVRSAPDGERWAAGPPGTPSLAMGPARPATAQDRPPPEESEEPVSPERSPLALLAYATAVNGALPKMGLGAGLALTSRLGERGTEVRLEGAAWAPQAWAPSRELRASSASVHQLSIGLGLCPPVGGVQMGTVALSVEICARAAGVRLASTGSADFGGAALYYGTLGSHIAVVLERSGFLAELSGGLNVALTRPGLVPQADGDAARVFRPRSSQPVISLAVGWRFGGSPPEPTAELSAGRGASAHQ